jgi:hypothetical protein
MSNHLSGARLISLRQALKQIVKLLPAAYRFRARRTNTLMQETRFAHRATAPRVHFP